MRSHLKAAAFAALCVPACFAAHGPVNADRTHAIVASARAIASADAELARVFARDGSQASVGGLAAVPDRAEDSLMLKLGGSTSIAVTLDGARGRGSFDGSFAVYPDAFRDADRIVANGRDATEDFVLLRSARAEKKFSWSFARSPGVRTIEMGGDGSLAIIDDRGRTRMRVPPPYAIDAAGTRHALQASWDPQTWTLAVDVPHAAWAHPVLVDPKFEAWSWSARPQLAGRSGQGMAYDKARHRVVLFGGLSNSGSLSDNRSSSAPTARGSGTGLVGLVLRWPHSRHSGSITR